MLHCMSCHASTVLAKSRKERKAATNPHWPAGPVHCIVTVFILVGLLFLVFCQVREWGAWCRVITDGGDPLDPEASPKNPPPPEFSPPPISPPQSNSVQGVKIPPHSRSARGGWGGQPPNYYKISEQALNNSIAFKSTIILCYFMII